MGLASMRRHRGGYDTRPVHAERSVEQLSQHELLARFHAERDRANELESRLNADPVNSAPTDSRIFPGRGITAGSTEEWELLVSQRIEIETEITSLIARVGELEAEKLELLAQLEAATAPASTPKAEESSPPATPEATDPTPPSAETPKADEPKQGSKSRKGT